MNDIFANLNYNPCYLEKIHFSFIAASYTFVSIDARIDPPRLFTNSKIDKMFNRGRDRIGVSRRRESGSS